MMKESVFHYGGPQPRGTAFPFWFPPFAISTLEENWQAAIGT